MYVGISRCPWSRLGQHLSESPWARNVAKVTVEWLDSRESALAAEARAITEECPLFNKAGKARATPSNAGRKVTPARSRVADKTSRHNDRHKPGYMAEYMRKRRAAKKAAKASE